MIDPIFGLPQGLVSVLKSLVDWEQSHRDLEKLKINQQEGISAEDSSEIRVREDVTSDFEKAKAHKSTLEAAIAEVYIMHSLSILTGKGKFVLTFFCIMIKLWLGADLQF